MKPRSLLRRSPDELNREIRETCKKLNTLNLPRCQAALEALPDEGEDGHENLMVKDVVVRVRERGYKYNQPQVSGALRRLLKYNFVSLKRRGKGHFYSKNPDQIRRALELIDSSD